MGFHTACIVCLVGYASVLLCMFRSLLFCSCCSCCSSSFFVPFLKILVLVHEDVVRSFLCAGSRTAFSTCTFLTVNTLQQTSCSVSKHPAVGLLHVDIFEVAKYLPEILLPHRSFFLSFFLSIHIFSHWLFCV